MKYYTDDEMIARMQELTKEGKPLTAICDDPKCKPDFKKKIQKLQDIGWEVEALRKKGGQR